MDRIDTTTLNNSIDLTALAGQYTTLRGGREKYGPCPKCEGRDRFHVTGQWFFCRKCHPRRGDAIEFAQWLHGFDFAAACDWLTNGHPPTQAGIQTPRPKPRPAHPPTKPPAAKWQQRAAAFVEYAQAQLWKPEGRAGLDYLFERGFSEATIKASGLGYNPKDFNRPAHRWGVTGKKNIWLPGPGIVIPWPIDNALHRVNIRLLEPRRNENGDTIKYIGPAGWGGANPLYNADSVIPTKPAILVEGEFCALTIQQTAGDLITPVATGSVTAARAGRWPARLAGCPLVLVALDNAPEGEKNAKYWLELLPNAKRWRPLLKDINDMHRAKIDVRKWIRAALPIAPESGVDFGWPRRIIWPVNLPVATIEGQNRRVNGGIEATYQDNAELALCLDLTKFARELTEATQ